MSLVSGPRGVIAIWLAFFVAVSATLWLFSSILLPFILGAAIAYLLDPVVDRCEDLGLGRSLATTLVLIVATLAAFAVTGLLLPVVVDQAQSFADTAPDRIRRILAWLDQIRHLLTDRFGWELGSSAQDLLPLLSGEIGVWALTTLQNLFRSGAAIINVTGLLLVTPLVAWYLLRDWDELVARIDALLPRRNLAAARARFAEIDQVLAGFVRGQSTSCALLAGFYALALGLIGIPNGVLIGLFAGLISFVPYVGTILGLLLSVGLAALEFGAAWQTVVAGIVFAAGQLVDDYVLRPRLVGERLGLHPVGTIFALFAGGALLGFVGILVAVPAAAVIAVLLRSALAWYRESGFYRET